MRKFLSPLVLLFVFFQFAVWGNCDENRITFFSGGVNSAFADLFSDSGDATWYQLWAGNTKGYAGNYVDTSLFNSFGDGWIQRDDLSQLTVDYAQADAVELWVRPWDSVNKTGAWVHGSVDFSAACQGKVTRTINGDVPMDQLFVDENIAPGAWYQVWIANADGTGAYLDTTHLNNYGNGWVKAENLSKLTYSLPEGVSSQELWVKAYSGGKTYGWDHWTITGATMAYAMTDYFPMAGSWETDQRTLFMGVAPRQINGVQVVEMADTESPKVLFWTNDDDGLRIHGVYGAAVLGDHGEENSEIFDSPLVFAQSTVCVGDVSMGTLVVDGVIVNISVEFMGVEEVTVPAGTFADCLKFRYSEWAEGEMPGDNGYETIWLARDVGFVKSVNSGVDDTSIFTEGGETRQLLSYFIPSDLTDDRDAIHSLLASTAAAWEEEDLTGLMALYSENFNEKCMDKSGKETQEQEGFNIYNYDKICMALEQIEVSENRASAMVEYYSSGTRKSDGSGWHWSGRKSVEFIKENGIWFFHGSHMSLHPSGSGWFLVFSRNTEYGPYVGIAAGLHDCSTGSRIRDLNGVSACTITGPPGSGIEDTNLMDSWDGGSFEFWNSIFLDYNTVSSGFYTFEFQDTLGNVSLFSDYFEKSSLLAVPVPSAPSDGQILMPGTTVLSWNDVPGADIYRIDFETYRSGTWQRENLNSRGTSYTIEIEPETNYRWRIRARQLDRLNGDDYYDNESRNEWDYFSTNPGSTGALVFDSAYLQYRTQENGSDQYRGWCDFFRGNDIAYESDITSLILKDEAGNIVATQSISYFSSPLGYYWGQPSTVPGIVDYSGPLKDSGYSIRFPEGTALSAGKYTYEATTRDNGILTFDVEFPGMEVLPFVNSSSMVHTWQDDGSLLLNWENPVGSYDQIRVSIYDQDWNDILSIRLFCDAESVTIPASVVENIKDSHNPVSLKWQVQTRSYFSNNNHARGYSNTLDFPYQGN